MMWNEQSTQKTNSTSLTWEELVQSLPPMVVKVEDLAITEQTDFVIVGSAKAEEEQEETQPERNREGISEDSDEDSDEAQDDTSETWFSVGLLTRPPYTRVSRNPHRAYRHSWTACQNKVRGST